MFERWDEVELDLRVEATLALDEGLVPPPQLVAFGPHEALGMVTLRPFGPEGPLSALIEVLALLLPLGARRVALALPGRLREVPEVGDHMPADPDDVSAVTDGVSAATDGVPAGEDDTASGDDVAMVGPGAMLVVATAETTPAGAALAGRVLPLAHDGDCWQWRDDEAVDLDADDWEVTRALGELLRACDDLYERPRDRHELQAQLGRCLLLGHAMLLTPVAADLLEPARIAPGPAMLWPPAG